MKKKKSEGVNARRVFDSVDHGYKKPGIPILGQN